MAIVAGPPPPPAIEPPPPEPPAEVAVEPAAVDRPRRVGKLRWSDIGELVGSAAASLALTWLMFNRLTPLSGPLGFVVVWYLTFLLIYWLVSRDGHGAVIARDRLATVVVTGAAGVVMLPLVTILLTVLTKGLRNFRWSLFTDDLADTSVSAPLHEGGLLHAVVGTLEQVGIAMLISVPLGILTAVYLNEVRGRLRRYVRTLVDAMSGLPSIVAGLFIYAVIVLGLGWGFSGFAASMALAMLMLPLITRTTEEVLRIVPDGLREAALALGAPEWRVTTRVVLPTARAGIVTAVILGVARAVGETAPVLLTAAGSSVLNVNPMDGPQSNLPLYIYQQVLSQVDNARARAWTGALVLITLVVVLFTVARIIASFGPGQRRHRIRNLFRRRQRA
jgi:phosphate transport system permease protein